MQAKQHHPIRGGQDALTPRSRNAPLLHKVAHLLAAVVRPYEFRGAAGIVLDGPDALDVGAGGSVVGRLAVSQAAERRSKGFQVGRGAIALERA
ncbi:hypothetical protein D3C71_1725770 [compost metagenome]